MLSNDKVTVEMGSEYPFVFFTHVFARLASLALYFHGKELTSSQSFPMPQERAGVPEMHLT